MNKELVHLVERIRLELAELEGVLLKIEEAWNRSERYGDSYYLLKFSKNTQHSRDALGTFLALHATFRTVSSSSSAK